MSDYGAFGTPKKNTGYIVAIIFFLLVCIALGVLLGGTLTQGWFITASVPNATTCASVVAANPTLCPTCAAATPANSTNTITGCDGDPQFNITCPSGTLLSGSVKYGRWDNTTCPGTGVTPTTPPKSQTLNFPTSCIGQSTCNLTAPNVALGVDPYPNVAKQVSATYTCGM